MAPNVSKDLASISLAGSKKTAIIVGATTGIGAAVARLFAQLGCSRIIVFGRNETRANEVLQAMKSKAPQELSTDYVFVKGDVSDVKGMRAAAEALQDAVKPGSIDYLIMCQNGPPTGIVSENSDGVGTEFAIQAVSRFALTYLLTSRDCFSPHAVIMSICNPGLSLSDLSVDDLSLKKRRDAGRSKFMLAIDQSRRDSTVIDSFIAEFNNRYPKYRYYHVHPGLVRTELFNADAFPFPMNWLASMGLRTFATTPDFFAQYAVWLAVSPDAIDQVGSGKYFDQTLTPKKLGAWPSSKENREKLWEKLMEMIGEK